MAFLAIIRVFGGLRWERKYSIQIFYVSHFCSGEICTWSRILLDLGEVGSGFVGDPVSVIYGLKLLCEKFTSPNNYTHPYIHTHIHVYIYIYMQCIEGPKSVGVCLFYIIINSLNNTYSRSIQHKDIWVIVFCFSVSGVAGFNYGHLDRETGRDLTNVVVSSMFNIQLIFDYVLIVFWSIHSLYLKVMKILNKFLLQKKIQRCLHYKILRGILYRFCQN